MRQGKKGEYSPKEGPRFQVAFSSKKEQGARGLVPGYKILLTVRFLIGYDYDLEGNWIWLRRVCCVITIDDAVELCVLAGGLLLGSNAEIDRTESTIGTIAKGVGMVKAEVFAIPTGLVLTLEDRQGNRRTQVLRVSTTTNDLSVVDEVNGVSRRLVAGTLDPKEAIGILQRLSQRKPLSPWRVAPQVGLACGSIAYLIGGSLLDGGIVWLISCTAHLLSSWLNRMTRYRILSTAAGAVWVTFWVLAASRLVQGLSVDTAIVGALMLYVPGITITNGIRDLTAGNLLSGAARVLDALLVALILAFGVGAVLSLNAKVAIF